MLNKISDFLCKVCTYIFVRIVCPTTDGLKTCLDVINLEFNILNGHLQIFFRGRPFYWGLKYKQRVADNKRLIILANGPSLNEDLGRLRKEDLSNADFLMMNFSSDSELFQEFKPKYYCLADHMFFKKDYRYERVQKMFSALNSTLDWDMTLFIAYNIKVVQKFSGLNNPQIKYQRIFSLESKGPKVFQRWVCKCGYAIPGLGTVANMAAYIGIQYGYKQIEFCGNDMSFFDGICVNDDNIVCISMKHFYEKDAILKPIMLDNIKKQSLESYVDMVLNMIKGHNRIAEYGGGLGVRFVNRTRKSMLDCYPRLIKESPEEF